MDLTRVDENTTKLTRFRLINMFLVLESDGFTLIDTGIRGCEKLVAAAAALYTVPVRRILLSHAHSDHIGSLDSLAASGVPAGGSTGEANKSTDEAPGRAGKLPVAISERGAPLLRADLSLRPGEPQTPLKKTFFPGAGTRPTHLLTDGELFGSLRSFLTPGHSPDHMSFLDERTGTLFAGDALVSVGGTLRTVMDSPWFFPLPRFASWDRDLANAAAERLLLLRPETVVCGHGRVVRNGKVALRRALQRAGLV